MPLGLSAQQLDLNIEVHDIPERDWPFDRSFADSLSTEQALYGYLRALRADGHWVARLDSAAWNESTLQAFITRGSLVYWAEIHWSDESFALLPRDPKLQRWKGRTLQANDWSKWQQRVLTSAENNGYPFARLQWDTLSPRNDSLRGSLTLNPGPYIRFDSVNVRGYDEITEAMVANLLDLKVGSPYSEKTLRDLQKVARDIEYLNMPRSPQVLFNRDKTVVFTYLEKQKANQFDGILGFNTNDGVVTLTGNVYLRLLNAFDRGEELVIDWSSPGNTTQKLDLRLSYPYLFGWSWAIEGVLNLLKQDSSFLNLQSDLGLRYFLNTKASMSFTYQTKSSSTLGDEAIFGVTDYTSRFYNIGLRWRTTDRRIAPRNGQELEVKFGLGERNANDSSQTQYNAEIDFKNYWQFTDLLVLVNRFQYGRFDGDIRSGGLGSSYYNELFRFGGIQNLRGFDEQSLFVSEYLIGTFELRLLTGSDGYFLAFTDFGFTQSGNLIEVTIPTTGSVWSFGAGAAFKTPAGLLNLTYALGRREGGTFQFDRAKVHIGLVNQF